MAATFGVIIFSLLIVFSRVPATGRRGVRARDEGAALDRSLATSSSSSPRLSSSLPSGALTSFKPESEIFSTEVELVDERPRSRTTRYLLTRGDFHSGRQLALRGDVTTIFAVFLAATCAYALSRYRFRGRSASLYVFLVAQMFPGVILLVPLFNFFTNLGLIDPPWRWSSSYATIAIPFCVLMLKTFFDTIPYDLEEAGMVDGLGVFGAFWRIVLPLSVPGWR